MLLKFINYKVLCIKVLLTYLSTILLFSLNYAHEIPNNNELNIPMESKVQISPELQEKNALLEEIKKARLELKACMGKNSNNTIKCRDIALGLSLLAKKYKEKYSELQTAQKDA